MERFVPAENFGFEDFYEHIHRYHFAAQLAEDKIVCDIACGDGYGSMLLSQHASHVSSVDIDAKTIELARQKYGSQNNLDFFQSDALNTPFADHSFDCIVSFETLEHLYEHELLLNEFKRILKPEGVLMISTPDKDIYSGDTHHNEFHEKELTKKEFQELMEHKFRFCRSWGQKIQIFSVIDACSESKDVTVQLSTDNLLTTEQHTSKHKYQIMVCSDDEDAITRLTLSAKNFFSVKEDSLFNHHERQIKRLIEVDKQNLALLKKVDQQRYIIEQLMSRLGL